MAAAMRDTATATNRAVDQMNLNGNPNNNVSEDESDGGNGRPMTLATFLKVKPPEFKGIVNVTEADDWFQAMERSLQVQRVPAEQYVDFAELVNKCRLAEQCSRKWANARSTHREQPHRNFNKNLAPQGQNFKNNGQFQRRSPPTRNNFPQNITDRNNQHNFGKGSQQVPIGVTCSKC
ncbi:hypothetical protein PIB30_093968 [Stylosanthes scabra]|uniref:Gag protein n=1 Tax=Stylosanthes scabra TaxID=79078 RepID=A0ABU6VYK3_9FABA|nr:hypothetical protein [Stylosanthes scabra]